jgi:hypothetical protein
VAQVKRMIAACKVFGGVACGEYLHVQRSDVLTVGILQHRHDHHQENNVQLMDGVMWTHHRRTEAMKYARTQLARCVCSLSA